MLETTVEMTLGIGTSADILLKVSYLCVTLMRGEDDYAEMVLTPAEAVRLRDWLTANLPAETPRTVHYLNK